MEEQEKSLTPLESELMRYVERLTIAFESSVQQFEEMNPNSRKALSARLKSIERSIISSLESQVHLSAGLTKLAHSSRELTLIQSDLKESEIVIQQALKEIGEQK